MEGPAMTSAVVARNVWKLLGRRWVLRNINVEIREGEAALIVGPNGSGKSTFLKITAGVWRPSRGSVRVFGLDPASPRAKELIGVVLHENLLYEELSVEENLAFYSRFYAVDQGFLEEVLELLGLRRVWRRSVGELSFGWRRRANIARALLHSPKLLVIDEPLTGLDPGGREAVVELLARIVGQGGTVLAASPTPEPSLTERLGATTYRVEKGGLRRVE